LRDECLHEQDVKMMARCIELDRSCATIRASAVRLMASGSEFAARICGICAEFLRFAAMNARNTSATLSGLRKGMSALRGRMPEDGSLS
jgi:hypothetical protein